MQGLVTLALGIRGEDEGNSYDRLRARGVIRCKFQPGGLDQA